MRMNVSLQSLVLLGSLNEFRTRLDAYQIWKQGMLFLDTYKALQILSVRLDVYDDA